MLSLKNAGPSMLWLQSITNPHYIYTPHINWKSFSPLKIAMGSFNFVISSRWNGINKHFIHEIFTKNNHLKVKQHKEGHHVTVSSTQERQRQRVTEKTKLQCCNCVFPQVVTRILRSGCKIDAWIFRENVEHQGLL